MLRSVLVVLFWRAAHADDRCVGGWQAGDGYGSSGYETHIGNYASREQCIDAVKSRNDGANAATYTINAWSPYIVGDCFAEYGQTSVSKSSYWENCLFASDDQSTGSRDLDGDGVADAAAEGNCCINGYGMSFADSSCGNTLAEVTANCCWSPFVARYSIQPDGENQNSFDCVSFISKEDCNARGGLWSDDSQMAGQCPHTVNGDWGTGNGWCMSDLDDHVGDTSTPSACWTMCKDRYGSDLVAIDWTPDGECYCQDDCQCMEDRDDGNIHLITSSAVASLPNTCVSACPAEEAAFQTCISMQWPIDDDYFADDDDGGGYFLANGGQSCDDACASSGGCDLSAITAAAASMEACKRVLDDLGVSYGASGDYTSPGDSSGCTYHAGDPGWAQLFGNPTCGTVDPDADRERVCACNDDDDDDDDDDFAPNTCADVQEWLSTGECADGPKFCRAEYDAWVECHYEDMAREELGQACDFTCSPDKKSNRDNVGLLILIIVCSVAGCLCLLAISTAIIYSFGGCLFCFAKHKKKRMPARVAEPSSSAESAPVPLAVAQYAEPPPMSPGTFVKTQEHIRRTAALMAEAPPSPGPPPLAPIKATETLAPEMP